MADCPCNDAEYVIPNLLVYVNFVLISSTKRVSLTVVSVTVRTIVTFSPYLLTLAPVSNLIIKSFGYTYVLSFPAHLLCLDEFGKQFQADTYIIDSCGSSSRYYCSFMRLVLREKGMCIVAGLLLR